MGELTSERYKKFKANDCVKTEPDIIRQPSSRAISGGAIVSIGSAANSRFRPLLDFRRPVQLPWQIARQWSECPRRY